MRRSFALTPVFIAIVSPQLWAMHNPPCLIYRVIASMQR
jgi:hypothetical protein